MHVYFAMCLCNIWLMVIVWLVGVCREQVGLGVRSISTQIGNHIINILSIFKEQNTEKTLLLSYFHCFIDSAT